jgi:hypothetical protein
VVTNAFGSVTSAPAILSVVTAPVIVTSPTNQTVWTGSSVEFSVVAVGSPPLFYRWFFNGIGEIPGATSSTLQLTNVQPWQAGAYTVVVNNAYGAVTSPPATLEVFLPGTVLFATEAALRAALAVGGPVTFACDGTITLASTITIGTDTVLDGTGHQVTLSGGDAVRVFHLQTNVTFTAVNLTIANGKAGSNGMLTPGGGVLNDGGILNLLGVEFRTNTTMGWHWQGGAIFNSFGRVNATNCGFFGNITTSIPGMPPPSYPVSEGGAIYNKGGLVKLQDCAFVGNGSIGVDGPANGTYTGFPGGDCGGGAIYNAGTLNANRCTFLQNFAKGGSASMRAFWAERFGADLTIHKITATPEREPSW